MLNLAKSFLKTSQESRKGLMFSTQLHRVLISSIYVTFSKGVWH